MNSVVVGLQYGDEGKGSIVDFLSSNYDVVVRYQGGCNAGHTVVVGDNKYKLHHMPSGILRNKICIISSGMVVDLKKLINEINLLNSLGFDTSKLLISEKCHIIKSSHVEQDNKIEDLTNNSIGTTRRGIGPCYSDKHSRTGIRPIDILENSKKNTEDNLRKLVDNLKPYLRNTEHILRKYIKMGLRVLFEGAQGALLDINLGDYPYVTSSTTLSHGVGSYTGISLRSVNKIYGVAKCYTTRVGGGPFPTFIKNENIHDLIQKHGGEYGTTTGRPRKCGWLDLVSLKYACEINDVDEICLTKIDTLSFLKKIKACVGYIDKSNGKIVQEYSGDNKFLNSCNPLYIDIDGWCYRNFKKDIKGRLRSFDIDKVVRSKNFNKFINLIESFTNRRVSVLSYGPGRTHKKLI